MSNQDANIVVEIPDPRTYVPQLKRDLTKFWQDHVKSVDSMQIDFMEFMELPYIGGNNNKNRYFCVLAAIRYKTVAKYLHIRVPQYVNYGLREIFRKYGLIVEFKVEYAYDELPLVPERDQRQQILYKEHMSFPAIGRK